MTSTYVMDYSCTNCYKTRSIRFMYGEEAPSDIFDGHVCPNCGNKTFKKCVFQNG